MQSLCRDALEWKGHQRRPQKRIDRRLVEVAEGVVSGYCRLQMPLKLALAVRETVAGMGWAPWKGGGGGGTRPWWLALLACGSAYWPLTLEPSAMTCYGGGGVQQKQSNNACNNQHNPQYANYSANPHYVSDPLPQSFVGSS